MVSGNEKLDEVYYEVALDNAKNRNILVPRSQLSSFITNEKVVYRSMFGFQNTILDHFKIYKTVSSFKDKCYIESLVFDVDTHWDSSDLDSKGKPKEVFDDKEALMKVLEEGVIRTKELIKQLAEMTGTSEESIPIWYSGRGFHLQTPNFFNFKASTYVREEVAATMKHYFPFIDHKPYMTSGLIRMNYSYNDKSKTYKIPLHYSELDDINAILLKAQSPKNKNGEFYIVEWEEWDGYDLSSKIIVEKKKASNEKSKQNVTRIVTCVQKMFKEGPIKGNRHDVLLRMATAWRGKLGMTFEQSFILAKAYFQGEWSDYEITNQLTSIWDKMYNPYSCTDSVMAKYCDPDCIFYRGKNFSLTIPDNTTIEQKLRDNLIQEEDSKNPTFDLNSLFDIGTECKFRPGNMIVLFGHPKIGKSFLYQYLVHYSGKKTLYYTLEMPDDETYARQVAISMKESVEQAEDRVRNGEELFDKIPNISIINRSPTLDDVKNHILQFAPDWVVIDTIDKVSEDQFRGNETGRITYLFQEFKKIAIEYKIVVLIVQHIPGSEAKDKNGNLKSLDVWSGLSSKESGRSGDKILGWEGFQDSNLRTLRSLALRRGDPFRKEIEYSKEFSLLYPLNEKKEN